MYLVNSDLNLCCQCWSDVPPTPPDWLVNISTSEGDTKYTLYDGSSEECTKWRFLNVHDYYADKDTTYPVAFILLVAPVCLRVCKIHRCITKITL